MLNSCHCSAAVELNLNSTAINGNPLVQPSVRHGVEVAVSGGTSADNRSTDGNIPTSFTALLNDSSNDAPEGNLKIRYINIVFSLPFKILILTDWCHICYSTFEGPNGS